MVALSRLSVGSDFELDDIDAAGRRFAARLFGDKLGLAVFLGALVFFPVTWRVGILSTDNYVLANSVVAIADGHFHIEQIIFGPPDGITPGVHIVDGRLYGRNFGLVVPAVLVYLLLQTVSLVVDPRILLAGGWSLVVLALVVLVGERMGMRDRATVVGSSLSLLLFGANIVTATSLDPYWFPVIALQTVTAVGAAMLAVVVYRLVSAIYDQRLGLSAGLATAVGTPVGFWATLPKRHTLTALLVLLTVYTLYRSRSASTGTWQTRFRGLAYAWIGLLAWVHAAEALVLFLGLLAVDLPTARRNGIRQLAFVGGVFLLSLVPFAITNTLIAGTPVKPPRMLPAYGGADTSGLSRFGGGGGGGGTLSTVSTPLVILAGQYTNSLSTLLEDPGRLATVFLRRGYVASVNPDIFKPIHLSVLESMPLLGTLAVVPLLAWRRLQRELRSLSDSPVRVTDAFVFVTILLWVGLYLHRLPVHFQYTVRYLHPIYPLGIYILVRLRVVRNAVSSHLRLAIGSYTVATVLGTVGYVVVLASIDAVVSEAVQLYASVAFVLGVGVAVWTLAATTLSLDERPGAIVLGVATASMTVYILVSGFVTFAYTNEFLLPIGRFIAESLRLVNPYGYLF